MNEKESVHSKLFIYFSRHLQAHSGLNYIKINKECKLNSVLTDGARL